MGGGKCLKINLLQIQIATAFLAFRETRRFEKPGEGGGLNSREAGIQV